jgi:phosphoribosylformylglycinamidine cyclo-ligase
MTYAGSGVNYADLDPFKLHAMQAAEETKRNMEVLGFEELGWSRGESAYLFRHRMAGLIFAFVVEGLGTANIVAENPQLREKFGETFYRNIAISNAAMVFNDMITVGALPIVFGLHPAVEDGKHLTGYNGADLVMGTKEAMTEAHCTYGPGETPALKNIIVPGTMCLSGSAVGIVRRDEHLMSSQDVREGLRIVMLASTGVHANGLTLARRIAAAQADGYLTDIGDGRTFGEALLAPTQLYVEFTRRCQDVGLKLWYGVNITGHGWRKLMRAQKELTYVVTNIPEIPPLFRFIMQAGPVELREMYATYNMGAGYAVFVEACNVAPILGIADQLGIPSWDAGEIIKGERQVVIEPHNLVYKDLAVR